MAFRYDTGSLRSPKRTATGLRADAYITRTGVFAYRNPDGSTRLELREDAEVKSPESLASFESVPVTDNHPPVKLDTANATQYARGATGENVRADGDKVRSSIVVYDAALIARMERGTVEVSCGYECDLDETPGVHPRFGRYDAIQRNIRGNHVAIVDAGRAGPDVRVRMDAAVMIDTPPTLTRQDHAMDFEKLFKEASERAAAEKARADKAEGERDAATKRADTAEGALASEKARADAAEKARTDAAAAEPLKIRARVALEATCAKVFKADELAGLTAKTDRDMKVAFVERVDGEKIPTEKSDDYVDAYFASASKRADAAAKGVGDVNSSLLAAGQTERSDADPETVARQKMIAENAARAAQGSN